MWAVAGRCSTERPLAHLRVPGVTGSLFTLQGVPACDPRRARVGAVALSSAAAASPVSSAQRRGTRQPPTDGLGGAGYAERMQLLHVAVTGVKRHPNLQVTCSGPALLSLTALSVGGQLTGILVLRRADRVAQSGKQRTPSSMLGQRSHLLLALLALGPGASRSATDGHRYRPPPCRHTRDRALSPGRCARRWLLAVLPTSPRPLRGSRSDGGLTDVTGDWQLCINLVLWWLNVLFNLANKQCLNSWRHPYAAGIHLLVRFGALSLWLPPAAPRADAAVSPGARCASRLAPPGRARPPTGRHRHRPCNFHARLPSARWLSQHHQDGRADVHVPVCCAALSQGLPSTVSPLSSRRAGVALVSARRQPPPSLAAGMVSNAACALLVAAAAARHARSSFHLPLTMFSASCSSPLPRDGVVGAWSLAPRRRQPARVHWLEAGRPADRDRAAAVPVERDRLLHPLDDPSHHLRARQHPQARLSSRLPPLLPPEPALQGLQAPCSRSPARSDTRSRSNGTRRPRRAHRPPRRRRGGASRHWRPSASCRLPPRASLASKR